MMHFYSKNVGKMPEVHVFAWWNLACGIETHSLLLYMFYTISRSSKAIGRFRSPLRLR
jgi:hypothetical protein